MRVYFEEICCKMPNGEWEIETMDKTDIHLDYKMEVIKLGKDEEYLSYAKFVELWSLIYPHVKIKKYKQVLRQYCWSQFIMHC